MKKMLIVDDEESIRTLLTNFFLNKYEIHTANNGLDAVKLCTKSQFDVVILDIFMPVLDGVEAAKAIRITQPSIKIIAISGIADIEPIKKIKKLNIEAFFEKPINLNELKKETDRIINL